VKKWSTRFELKPGRWVFVPSAATVALGKEIKRAVQMHWTAPAYFYHLQAGGHVAALKAHLGSTSFLRVDIEDFFGSINKTRVTRCLKTRFSYAKARTWANGSTVRIPHEEPARYIVPFGFVPSPIIASLCLDDSALGSALRKLAASGDATVSVYVDDIIISADEQQKCESALDSLKAAAAKAQFVLHATKQQGPGPSISAFNVELAHSSLDVTPARLADFAASIPTASGSKRAGIIGYVASVNEVQGDQLSKL
jgi:Reverse transcriptase (RNA-dependent DNA polymerase)